MSRKHAKRRGGPKAASIAQPPTKPPPSPSAAATPLDEVAASDEAAGAFFSAPPVAAPDEPVFHEPPAERAPVRRPIGDAVRRRELAKYVTGAVAVCFMICVAAAVRAATVHAETSPPGPAYHERADAPRAMAGPAPAEPAAAVEVPPPPAVESAPEPPASEPPPAPAAQPAVTGGAVEATHEAAPDPAAGAKVDERPADPDAPREAREAKRAAQRAIDRGNAAGAIEAGKRSLELDPTDAETWLIVGAAYLQRGAFADARESFASCLREAKRGPRNECRALLR